jgi:GNAT superfamily N-acetyltransferase
MVGRVVSDASDFEIVPERVEHGAAVSDVLHVAYGYAPDAGRRDRQRELGERRVASFPEGQFVAVRRRGGGGSVVGVAITMRTSRPPAAEPLPWRDAVGDHGLPYHDPEGAWLYGVEIAVHPSCQRCGVGSSLYRTRLALVEALGLEGWYAGGMLMGYHRHAGRLSPREYAERVIAGDLVDPTVTMQIRRGLRPAGIIEDYYREPKAGNCAVLLIWRPRAARAQAAAPTRGRARGGRARGEAAPVR